MEDEIGGRAVGKGKGKGGATTILLVLAHPFFENSVAQRGLLAETVSDRRIRLHDLYETYPDFAVNVRREQALLLSHPVVLLQFPMFWYSMPALLKEWIDTVFLAGFAFGDGARLAGTRLGCAVSTGQGADTYRAASSGGVGTLDELLLPLRSTARFCGMDWVPPFSLHGSPAAADFARYGEWVAALAEGDGR